MKAQNVTSIIFCPPYTPLCTVLLILTYFILQLLLQGPVTHESVSGL